MRPIRPVLIPPQMPAIVSARAREAFREPGASPALLAAAMALLLVTAHAAQAVDRYDPAAYVALSMVHAAIFAVVAAAVLMRPPRASDLLVILAVAIALRAMAVTTAPGLTTDAFRYVWDGRLSLAGISPYLYVPADDRLAQFRDAAIFPHLNQKETAFTIYPPAAQMAFAAGAWLDRVVGTATDAGHNGMKLVMLICEAVIVWALLRWLASERLPRERVLLYVWHPLPLWEFASQAHIDAAAAAFVVIAVLMAVKSRQGAAGALLAAATLVKYFPLVLIPALWTRWNWRMPLAFLATAAVLYAPHLWAAGPKVIGFLATHLDNEGYREGWGFHPVWFIRTIGLGWPGGPAYTIAALAVLGSLAFVVFFDRRRSEIRPAQLVTLAAAFVWITSSHYPWYFGWLVPLLTIWPNPPVMAMTLTAAALHLPRPPGGPTWTEIYALVYWGPLLLCAAWLLWTKAFALSPRTSRPRPRGFDERPDPTRT